MSSLSVAHVFLFFLFIKNITFSKSDGGQSDNPWEKYMKLYDIPNNHGSGIYNDLGGSISYQSDSNVRKGDSDKSNYFRFPVGKCPVFSKIIDLTSDFPFFHDVILPDNFSEKEFLNMLLKGEVPGEESASNVKGLNWPPNLGEKISKYKGLISPVLTESIHGCALYANKFEHCFNDKCMKHPFAYFMTTKLCYVLFSLWQDKKDSANMGLRSYKPEKLPNLNYIVFGTSNIESNWPLFCPMKPIKGAVFGHWQNNQCVKPAYDHGYTNFANCVGDLFQSSPDDGYISAGSESIYKVTNSTNGIGYNWANWNNNQCVTLNTKPNCLAYEKEGYAITSLDMGNSTIYELPPCISASNGWHIEASCGNLLNKIFTCTNGEWVANTGEKIQHCLSQKEWANIKIDPMPKINPSTGGNATSTPHTSGVESWATEGIFGSSIILFISIFLM